MQSNVRERVLFRNPTTAAEREGVAGSCVRNLHIAIPALIDSIDNRVEQEYTGWPDRLYLIGSDGRVLFKSEPGPFGFDPKKLNSAISRLNPNV
jgi:type I thyroxine 5'-deiodinase